MKKKKAAAAQAKEAPHGLGNYHELAAPGGNLYADASSPAQKYGHSLPPGAGEYGRESAPAELSDQRVMAELGPTSPTTRHSPYLDSSASPRDRRE